MPESAEPIMPARVRIGRWITIAWDWFLQDLGMLVLIGLVPLVLCYTGLIFFVFGPVAAGLAAVGLRKAGQGEIEFADFANGFARNFLPALLSGLLLMVFSFIGFLFLIVPGLVILAMYQFTFHFIADRKQDFWEAMESSRKIVSRDYFGFSAFLVLLFAINVLGMLFFLVGSLVAVPVTLLAITAAYQDFTGRLPEPAPPPTDPVQIE